MYGFDHGVWMLGGWILMLALWLLPFALLFLAAWFLLSKIKSPPSDKTALQILEEAYARRQIGREEFLQKRDDLQRAGKDSP
jgi:putative membrane protein